MSTHFFDRQAAGDGRTLRFIGLMLQRDEHGVASPAPVRCAWCDAEAGRKPDLGGNETHGMCPRHHAQTRANLEELRRQRRAA